MSGLTTISGRLPRRYQLEQKVVPLSTLEILSFVYRKIVELLVLGLTNVVTHLLQEFAFSQNLSALIIFNILSASHVYCTYWET